MYVEYSSNNSGGSWWLTDQNWKDLEQAGWIVVWCKSAYLYDDNGSHVRQENGLPTLIPIEESDQRFSFAEKDKNGDYRSLGALAKSAYRIDLPLMDAVEEWEKITGLNSLDAGCACCGQPHYFSEYNNENKCVKSGPDTEYVAAWE